MCTTEINKAYCKQPDIAIKTGYILSKLQKGLDKTNHGFPIVKRSGKINHGFPHLSQMGSFPWEEHKPWVSSMLSQMGSFPLEEHSCRVPFLMSQMGSFPLEEPERVPSLWSPSMRSNLAVVDPKPASQNVSYRNDKRC